MLSRVVVPAGVLLAAAPLAAAATSVHAATDEEKAPAPAPARKVKTSELPIYGEPMPVEVEYIPEPSTPYREAVSSCRKSVWSATEGMQGGIDSVKSGINIAGEYAADFQKRVQEDTGVLQRAGIITVAGLGGVVAGYKGGIFRKAVLASACMTTAAAICYPNQAVDISNSAWGRVKQEGGKLYEEVVGKTENKPDVPEKKPETAPKADEKKESKDVKVIQEGSSSSSPASPAKLDHGQSTKEDKDMYTTRS